MALNPTGMNSGPQSPLLPINEGGTGGPGNYNAGNAQNPTAPPAPVNTNPFMVPPAGTAPVMNPGTTTAPTSATPGATGGPLGGQTDRQQGRTLGELQKYYGEGMGSLIYQYLQSGGGYNSALADQTVKATNDAMLHNIEIGMGNLTSTLGASGISPNSSVSALETSNYESNAMTQMNAIDAQIYNQMYESGQNRELSMLMQTGDVNAKGTANQPTFWSTLSNILGIGGAAAGGASAITSAVNPNADTSVLDALALL